MKTAKQSIDLEYKGTKKRLNLRTALISLCMFAFVGTSAQTGTVTVKLRNASVKELFSAIEKQNFLSLFLSGCRNQRERKCDYFCNQS